MGSKQLCRLDPVSWRPKAARAVRKRVYYDLSDKRGKDAIGLSGCVSTLLSLFICIENVGRTRASHDDAMSTSAKQLANPLELGQASPRARSNSKASLRLVKRFATANGIYDVRHAQRKFIPTIMH